MSYKDWAALFRVNTYGCLVIAGICVAKGWGVYAFGFLMLALVADGFAITSRRYAKEQGR